MNEYLIFPVKVVGTKVVCDDALRARVIVHQNMESALLEAGNRIPLKLGERLAVVLLGKVK